MEKNFAEKMAYLHEHIKKIAQHYKEVNENHKDSDIKKIVIDENYELEVNQTNNNISSISYSIYNYNLFESFNKNLDLTKLKKKELEQYYQEKMKRQIFTVTQYDFNNKNGKLVYTQGTTILNDEIANNYVQQYKIEEVILAYSNLIQEKLNHNYENELREIHIIELPNNGAQLYFSKLEDEYNLEIDFQEKYELGNHIIDKNGHYNFKPLKQTFKLFDYVRYNAAFEYTGSLDDVKDNFNKFYSSVMQLETSIYKDEIKLGLNMFKEELAELRMLLLQINSYGKKMKNSI